jgi:archaellum component FlaC
MHSDIHYKVKIEWPEVGSANRKMIGLQKQLNTYKSQIKQLEEQITQLGKDSK